MPYQLQSHAIELHITPEPICNLILLRYGPPYRGVPARGTGTGIGLSLDTKVEPVSRNLNSNQRHQNVQLQPNYDFDLLGDAGQAQDLPLSRLWKSLQRTLQPDETHARAHGSQAFCLQGFLDLDCRTTIDHLNARFVAKASDRHPLSAITRSYTPMKSRTSVKCVERRLTGAQL